MVLCHADLHIHSRFSRATSKAIDIPNLEKYAKIKGLNLLSTGDFTHPKWFQELKENLIEAEGAGIYQTKTGFKFLLSTEVSNIYKQGNKIRKIHSLIFAPSFEIVNQINERLLKWGRLDYDGRPIFGKTCVELVDLCSSISKDIEIIPAHAWTPWFGIFGSKSGFDSIEECFAEKSKHIHAIETGLSSDPAMNWRLSALDNITLVSFSDAHSFWPWRIGRECTVFDLEKLTYDNIIDAIRKKDKKRIKYTLEFFPEEGKYHFDGHRNCNISLSPTEAKKYNNICPVCHKPLTLGVLHRVEDLADRPNGFIPKDVIQFKKLIPLSELIAAMYKTAPHSKSVWRVYNQLINSFDSELNVLLETQKKALENITHPKIAEAIIKNREGKIEIKPGYDGVYGELLFEKIKDTKPLGQKTLGEF